VAVASAGQYASLHLIPDNHANIPPFISTDLISSELSGYEVIKFAMAATNHTGLLVDNLSLPSHWVFTPSAFMWAAQPTAFRLVAAVVN